MVGGTVNREEDRSDREAGRSRAVNLLLRYVGILVPLALSLGLFFRGQGGSHWLAMALSVGVWLVVTATLLVRRDWQGALAITVIYVFLNWWVVVFTLAHATVN